MKLFSAILLLLLTGCASQPKNTLMQISTIDALLTGAYDGQMASGELLRYGNLGIGTFDRLEGEMIVIDRKIYQACADGLVREMPDSATTPFATVVNFESDQTLELNTPLTAEALRTKADALAPEKNLFLALRIDGTFSAIKVRSVPKQKKPYPPPAPCWDSAVRTSSRALMLRAIISTSFHLTENPAGIFSTSLSAAAH
jgi:acetolactate decarboxylase